VNPFMTLSSLSDLALMGHYAAGIHRFCIRKTVPGTPLALALFPFSVSSGTFVTVRMTVASGKWKIVLEAR